MRVLALLVALAAAPAIGAGFVVEEGGLVSPPEGVVRAVESMGHEDLVDRSGVPCHHVGKPIALDSGAPSLDWILTTADACSWAASAAPVWVVHKVGNNFKVVLFHVTYDVTVGTATTNGLRNISTARATAAQSEEQLWKFNGKRYAIATTRGK